MTDENDHLKDRVPHDKSPSEGLQPTVALFWGLYLGVVFTLLVALVLSGEDVFSWTFWGGEEPDRSAILRNLGLVAIGVIGLPLAVWRGITAFQQAEAANKQAATANRQADLAEKGQIIDRYQKGAQMLESDELAVRMAGVFALRELALNEPDEMYILVLDMLAAFIREKSKSRTPDWSNSSKKFPYPNYGSFPPDLQAGMDAISIIRNHSEKSAQLEKRVSWKLDLRSSNLSGATLIDANLNDSWLHNAIIISADLFNSKCKNMQASSAKIIHCQFSGAEISNYSFSNCDMSHSNFFRSRMDSGGFFSCEMNKARFIRADIFEVNFENCVLSNSHFVTANFSNSMISSSDITNADFQNAQFSSDVVLVDLYILKEKQRLATVNIPKNCIFYRSDPDNFRDYLLQQ